MVPVHGPWRVDGAPLIIASTAPGFRRRATLARLPGRRCPSAGIPRRVQPASSRRSRTPAPRSRRWGHTPSAGPRAARPARRGVAGCASPAFEEEPAWASSSSARSAPSSPRRSIRRRARRSTRTSSAASSAPTRTPGSTRCWSGTARRPPTGCRSRPSPRRTPSGSGTSSPTGPASWPRRWPRAPSRRWTGSRAGASPCTPSPAAARPTRPATATTSTRRGATGAPTSTSRSWSAPGPPRSPSTTGASSTTSPT